LIILFQNRTVFILRFSIEVDFLIFQLVKKKICLREFIKRNIEMIRNGFTSCSRLTSVSRLCLFSTGAQKGPKTLRFAFNK
jgi:hypothetical protein